MPLIHCWQDILDQGDDWLTPAETLLIKACKAGEECKLGDGSLPPEGTPDPAREIRANILRYLILGGCDTLPVRGWGVQLIGGHITGKLDLSFAIAQGVTWLVSCRFDQAVTALQTRFEFLNLNNSHFPALNAQGAQVTGNVVLSDITATGQVRLPGAEIDGQLDCTGATFSASSGHALNAEGAQVKGGVFLRDITATGQVRLLGAEIGGQLDCTGATFSASEGDALNAQKMRVHEGLIWRKVKTPSGMINLNSAHVGDLVDEIGCWPEGERLILDGFTYDRISGAATDAKTRIAWLEKGSTWQGEFFPQPFTHLAKVLRGTGHELDAQKVLIKRDQLLGKYACRRAWQTAGLLGKAVLLAVLPLRILFDWLFRNIAGYGHRPILSLYWLIGLIMSAAVFAHLAYDEGSFAPNSGPILVSQGWQDYAAGSENPAERWSTKGAPGQDWETFYAGAWAADLVIPIIDLGQSDAWAPSTTRGPWGWHLWWARWVFILMGWVVTALGAAALTGVIRRE